MLYKRTNFIEMLYKLSPILFFLFLLSSCSKNDKEDVQCDNAILNICNPTSNQIVIYSWNSNSLRDTLFPGECVPQNYGFLSIKYNNDGSLKEKKSAIGYFHTSGAVYAIELEDCFVNYEAPGGYVPVAHCYNGFYDPIEGELNTDCGGFCRPCSAFSAPCDSLLVKDEFRWGSGTPKSLSSSYYGDKLNNKLILRFTFSMGDQIEVAIPSSELLERSEKFIIGQEYYKAEAWYSDRFGFSRRDVPASDSTFIYYLVHGNQKKIQFCGIPFVRNGVVWEGNGELSFD